ncbi:hypothetical protein D3C74_226840 [compost metagenome]
MDFRHLDFNFMVSYDLDRRDVYTMTVEEILELFWKEVPKCEVELDRTIMISQPNRNSDRTVYQLRVYLDHPKKILQGGVIILRNELEAAKCAEVIVRYRLGSVMCSMKASLEDEGLI